MVSYSNNRYADESTQTVQQGWAAIVTRSLAEVRACNHYCNLPGGEVFLRSYYASIVSLYDCVRHEFTTSTKEKKGEKETCDELVRNARIALEAYELKMLRNQTNKKLSQYNAFRLKQRSELYEILRSTYNKIADIMKLHGIFRFLRIDLAEKTIEEWTQH